MIFSSASSLVRREFTRISGCHRPGIQLWRLSTLYQRKCFAQHGNSNPSDLLSDVHKVLKFFFFRESECVKTRLVQSFWNCGMTLKISIHTHTHSHSGRITRNILGPRYSGCRKKYQKYMNDVEQTGKRCNRASESESGNMRKIGQHVGNGIFLAEGNSKRSSRPSLLLFPVASAACIEFRFYSNVTSARWSFFLRLHSIFFFHSRLFSY